MIIGACFLFICGLSFTLALGFVLWKALAYYSSLPGLVNSTWRDEHDLDIRSLLPPGWFFLACFPFIGKQWFDNVARACESARIDLSAPTLFAIRMNPVEFSGGMCILIEEQYEPGSGEASSVRLHPLTQHSITLVSGLPHGVDAPANHLPIRTARSLPEKRDWAVLSKQDNTYAIQGLSRLGLITILRNVTKPVLLSYNSSPLKLQSGDLIVVGISEFEFLALPHLGLWDTHDRSYTCHNIDIDQDILIGNRIQGFAVRAGRLKARHSEIHHPIEGRALLTDEEDVILQPGDILRLDDGHEYMVTYFTYRGKM